MARSVVCWALAALLLAAPSGARTLEIGQGKEFPAPSAAAAVAQDGDNVAIQPGEYTDCAIWRANRLLIEGVGEADKVVIADKSCAGKALFVTVGQGITIRNLTLTRARVPGNNGAGIRGEGRDLSVDRVRFIDNQNGILSGTTGGFMLVRDSVFERNGACDGACAHGVYVGNLDLLRVERSRFFATRHAHHIKSRALRTEVTGCVIEDGPAGTASYAIDVPNGGSLVARGNVMQKGPNTENHNAAISIGAEGVTHPTRELLIEDNRFRNDSRWDVAFVANMTGTEALLRGNRLSGAGRPLRGEGRVGG